MQWCHPSLLGNHCDLFLLDGFIGELFLNVVPFVQCNHPALLGNRCETCLLGDVCVSLFPVQTLRGPNVPFPISITKPNGG